MCEYEKLRIVVFVSLFENCKASNWDFTPASPASRSNVKYHVFRETSLDWLLTPLFEFSAAELLVVADMKK